MCAVVLRLSGACGSAIRLLTQIPHTHFITCTQKMMNILRNFTVGIAPRTLAAVTNVLTKQQETPTRSWQLCAVRIVVDKLLQ